MKVKHHLISFLFFVLIWVLQSWLFAPERQSISMIDLLITAFHMPGYIAVFYGSFYLFKTNKLPLILKIIVGIALLIGAQIFTHFITNTLDISSFIDFYFVSPFLWYELQLTHVLMILTALSFLGAITLFEKKELENQLKTIKENEMKVREKLLINQLQPHFLFNALNTIYGLARKQHADTASTILELSDLLRYSVDIGKNELVSLKDELHFIENYCTFQKKRLSSNVQFKLTSEITKDSVPVPPLLFQPLIENAFKHVNTDVEQPFLFITIKETMNHVSIDIKNSSFEKMPSTTGTGIELTRNRLAILFPDAFRFETIEVFPVYHTYCEIPLL
ncbi:hypothetical protein EP331_05055 [bacterium]|nr:MAG: hypothetical protein EP331_05055 [bacterium]